MSVLSNESFSPEVCAEGTLLFRAVVQRLESKQYQPIQCPRELTDECPYRAEVLCRRLGTEGADTELE